jgi:hypothetical protein
MQGWGKIKPPLGTPLRAGHPLVRGLVGLWVFNEGGTGTARDVSGYGNHCTVGADNVWTPAPTGYGPKGANTAASELNCGACSNWMDGVTPPLFLAYLLHTEPGNHTMNVGKWGAGASDQRLTLQFDATGVVTAALYTGSAAAYQIANTAAGAVKMGETAMVAMSWDATTTSALRVWVNGVRYGLTYTNNSAISSLPSSATVFGVGAEPGVTRDHRDTAQMICVSKRLWSDSDVSQLWADPWVMFTPPSPSLAWFGGLPATGKTPWHLFRMAS